MKGNVSGVLHYGTLPLPILIEVPREVPQFHTLALSRRSAASSAGCGSHWAINDSILMSLLKERHRGPRRKFAFFVFSHTLSSLCVFWAVVFNGWPDLNPVTSGANTATHLRPNQNTQKSHKNNQSHLAQCCIFYYINLKEVTFHMDIYIYIFLQFK